MIDANGALAIAEMDFAKLFDDRFEDLTNGTAQSLPPAELTIENLLASMEALKRELPPDVEFVHPAELARRSAMTPLIVPWKFEPEPPSTDSSYALSKVAEPGIYRAAAQWRLFEQLAQRDAIVAGLISERVGAVAPTSTPDDSPECYCDHVGRYMSRREHARLHAEERRKGSL